MKSSKSACAAGAKPNAAKAPTDAPAAATRRADTDPFSLSQPEIFTATAYHGRE